MGVISLPRLYFKGHLYWCPSTFNNNDVLPTYDGAETRPNWGYLRSQGVSSPDEFDRWAITPQTASVSSTTTETLPPAEWNYYGGNQCGFVSGGQPEIEQPHNFTKPLQETATTGHTGADGGYVGGAGDPWSGLAVRFNGNGPPAKMTDVDPLCFWSTQIFADSFTIGDEAAGVGFTAPNNSRMHMRWVNVFRNLNLENDLLIAGGVSTVFQTCLRRDAIRFFGPATPGGFQAQLEAALKGPDVEGLMVRFTVYTNVYFNGDAFAGIKPTPDALSARMIKMAELYQEYVDALAEWTLGKRADKPPPPVNRCFSTTVGWVGLWKRGELESVPGGRQLVPTVSHPTLMVPGTLSAKPQPQATTSLGPVVVEAAIDVAASGRPVTRLAVDLGSAMPENDRSNVKADFGEVWIGLVPLSTPTAEPTVIAKLPYAQYAKDSYERTAGVIDLPAASLLKPVTAQELETSLFTISVESASAPSPPPDVGCPLPVSRTTALIEAPYVAQTDQRGVYVNEPDAPWGPALPPPRFDVQVRYLGGKPPPGSTLTVAQYGPSPRLINQGQWNLVATTPGPDRLAPFIELLADGGPPGQESVSVQVPYQPEDGNAYSTVSVAVSPLRPGFPIVVFYPGAANPLPATIGAPSMATAFFAVVRVLPFHNQMAIEFEEWLADKPPLELVNATVFEQVFGTYHLLYPVMRFLRDPLTFQAWHGKILAITDPARFESSAYMPVTRAQSAGQRRILELWAEYLNTTPPPKAAGPSLR